MRKDAALTDALSLIEADNKAISQILCLMKLLKPVEFYVAALKVRRCMSPEGCVYRACLDCGTHDSSPHIRLSTPYA